MLANVGARPWDRDAHDTRLLADVTCDVTCEDAGLIFSTTALEVQALVNGTAGVSNIISVGLSAFDEAHTRDAASVIVVQSWDHSIF